MKDRKLMQEARRIRLISISFLREIPDNVIALNCDTRIFKVWGQVEENREHLLPKEKRMLNLNNVSNKYLINTEDIYTFLSSLECAAKGPILICNNLEEQNKRTFWCLKYIRFFRYKNNPTKFIVTDRAYNLLIPELVNTSTAHFLSTKEEQL